MHYTEVCFLTSENKEVVFDLLAAFLGDIGFESFSEQESGFCGYIPSGKFDETLVKEIIRSLPVKDEIHYTIKDIPPTNWNEEWEKHYFKPIIIENKCVIHSSFHQDIPEAEYDILIDPKMAFGTGHHETTSLMLASLLEIDLQKKSFLDMGCGTAVLAILAAMKGADPVLAIDIDEWAYNNAKENITLNKTKNISVELGGAGLLQTKGTFDYIFANINRNILLEDMDAYVKCMDSGSFLYMSGFYVSDIPVIREKAESLGLVFKNHMEKNNWTAVAFRKK
ncbi:MAG: 50S ribosomal protein L11 methyltransferase [Candidatus Azobacteroides sp.]|nr:50S ribosomal protein L11 methyltransferase [Candidatus Azobacteroides sp.]